MNFMDEPEATVKSDEMAVGAQTAPPPLKWVDRFRRRRLGRSTRPLVSRRASVSCRAASSANGNH
jgi:hypothetical protein